MEEWKRRTTPDEDAEDAVDLSRHIGNDHLESGNGMPEEVDRMGNSG